MIKYSINCFWEGFNIYDNFISKKYCKNHEFTNNYDEISYIILGCFINYDNYLLINNLKCKKILYVSEPIENFEHYKFTYKLYMENKFNYIIGSINNINNRYKIPFYLLYFDYNDNNIYNNINNYVKNCDLKQKEFCCLINRHDMKNTRTEIYNTLKNIDNIKCPSDLFNNCSNQELNNIGNIEYIKKFKFNICPENCFTNINGYITEKLLNCCLGGAIPIYYGWFDEIDEKIFNKNRILFYDPLNEESIKNIRDKILYLLNNEDEFNNFYSQDVFCISAYETIKKLEDNLINIINNL